MAKLLNLSVDVNKVTKERLHQGKKGKYLKLTIAVNDEDDQFGNNVQCWEGQEKEEREAKKDRNFLGNGRVFWTNEQPKSNAGNFGGGNMHEQPQSFGQPQQINPNPMPPTPGLPVEDELPF